jgi:hypothetical protein
MLTQQGQALFRKFLPGSVNRLSESALGVAIYGGYHRAKRGVAYLFHVNDQYPTLPKHKARGELHCAPLIGFPCMVK